MLRKKGQKVSASRADRETTEGSVFVRTNDDFTEGALIALNCETDFVAKNDAFQSLGKSILDAAFVNKPADLAAVNSMDLDGLTVAEKITELVGKIGEKLEISSYVTLKAETVVPYIHSGSKLGVLVGLQGANDGDVSQAGKDVAMQIAAMNPASVNSDDLDEAVKAKELQIGREQALEEGKPEAIIEKIAQGKLNKFLQENTLLSQKFVKDNSLTVAKYLDSVNRGLTVSSFERVSIG